MREKKFKKKLKTLKKLYMCISKKIKTLLYMCILKKILVFTRFDMRF